MAFRFKNIGKTTIPQDYYIIGTKVSSPSKVIKSKLGRTIGPEQTLVITNIVDAES